jgi:hypothetical protein
MRVSTRPLEGDAEAWDPDSPGPFADLAGSQLVSVAGTTAVVRDQDGHEMTVWPGYLVIRPDGAGDGEAFFTSQARFGPGTARVWGPVPG